MSYLIFYCNWSRYITKNPTFLSEMLITQWFLFCDSHLSPSFGRTPHVCRWIFATWLASGNGWHSYGKWSIQMVYLWNMMILNSYVKLPKDRFSILKDPFSLIEQATFAHQVQHFSWRNHSADEVRLVFTVNTWLTKCSCSDFEYIRMCYCSDFFFGFIFPRIYVFFNLPWRKKKNIYTLICELWTPPDKTQLLYI